MDFQAKWIRASEETGDVCPVYRKEFQTEGNKISRAELYITALGVYKACLNGKRIGGYVLAPGWTSYDTRLQYQVYDVTELLKAEDGQDEGNVLEVTVGKGWYASPMPGWMESEDKLRRKTRRTGVFAELHLREKNGNETVIATDDSWEWAEARCASARFTTGRLSMRPLSHLRGRRRKCLKVLWNF